MIRFTQRRDRSAIALLLLTILGVLLSRGAAAAFAGGAVLMIIAVLKARLVVLDYFGFRGTPGPWRALLFGWIALVACGAFASPLVQALR
ncbi:cytochrome C oxidase subunit IV family protein [Rhodopseudomonas palustris]|uniref:cytochrome C oxidase subunit IV family protein n=1 Tax=Rhodopseudomonas palustris TaxID=1076 RepID=UPI000641CC86|nr:cytochrome C oxidase subunit IV family protein [Rhodopseudomonas palustris]